MRPLISLACLLTVAVPLGSSLRAEDAGAHLQSTIHRAMLQEGEIVTPADKALIRAKCGLPANADVQNISLTNGVLLCPGGRTVRDAETDALGDRIGARANAYVAKVMNKPEVAAAMHAVADEASQKALRQLREQGVIRH